MQILFNKQIAEMGHKRKSTVEAEYPNVKILADTLIEDAEVYLGQDKEKIKLQGKVTHLKISPETKDITWINSYFSFEKHMPTGDIVSINDVFISKNAEGEKTWKYKITEGYVTTRFGRFKASCLSHNESGELLIIIKPQDISLDKFEMPNVRSINFRKDYVELQTYSPIKHNGEYVVTKGSGATLRFDNNGRFLSWRG